MQTRDELAHSLAPDGPKWLRQELNAWLSHSPRFADFCKQHLNKIASKLRGAKDAEDKRDVLVELKTALRLLAAPSFEVEYEPCVGGGPDLGVRTPFGNFYAEVKRIRETPAMTRFRNCIHRISEAIHEVPSSLVLSLRFSPLELDVTKEYAEKLDLVIDSVIGECVDAVRRNKNDLKPGESGNFSPRGFSDLQLTFDNLAEKPPDSPTALTVREYPIIYKQNEALKYRDHILDSLHQFRSDCPNVLVIWVDSDAHEPEELKMALAQIRRHSDEGNETFFQGKQFEGIQDFEDKFALLSAAVVMSGGSKYLVRVNPKGCLLDERVLDSF